MSATVFLLEGLELGEKVWVIDDFMSGKNGGAAKDNSNMLDQLLRGRRLQFLDGGEIYDALQKSALLRPFRWDEGKQTFLEDEVKMNSPVWRGGEKRLFFRLPPFFARGVSVELVRQTLPVADEGSPASFLDSSVLQGVPAYWQPDGVPGSDSHGGGPVGSDGRSLENEPPLVLRWVGREQ